MAIPVICLLSLDPPAVHVLRCSVVTDARQASGELALVDRANRGDAAAFEELYEFHRGWVLAIAYRFTGNEQDSLDVLQDTFAYLYGKFPGFELTTNLRGFLYPAVKHLALGKKRKESLTEAYADLAEKRLAVSPKDPDDLERMIRDLPEGQREVIWLRFNDDMKLKDIAASLDVPVGTVKSRLHLALQALRRTQEGEGASPVARTAQREAGS